MQFPERNSNVIVIADEITASFYASAGVQMLNGDLLEDDLALDLIESLNYELLLITEEYWEKLRDQLKKRKIQQIMLIPSFNTGSTNSVPVLKELSERAIGIDIFSSEVDDE